MGRVCSFKLEFLEILAAWKNLIFECKDLEEVRNKPYYHSRFRDAKKITYMTCSKNCKDTIMVEENEDSEKDNGR